MTLYRGIGGGGNATVDTELNLFTTLSQQAAQSATNASASEAAAEAAALAAADSAEAAANSAAAAETFNPSSSLVTYLPAGTGAVETTVQAKLRERVSVKDYGAVGNGVADDTAAIQAAINANPGRTIWFPAGGYSVAGTLTINAGVTLQGDGTSQTFVSQKTANVDTFRFAPTTAGTTSDFLNGAAIRDMTVGHTSVAATSTQGAGVRFVQCNGYKLFNVTVNNAPEGITVQGGQFGSLKSFQVFASSGLTASADTALLFFRQAPVGAGFQPCYTVEVEDFRLSASKLRETCIYIRNADGLQFANGYVALGQNSLLKVKAERDNSYVSAVSFANVYLDCVGAGNTPNGVDIPTDGFANSFVYQMRIGSGCVIGNGDQIGILVRKPEVGLLAVEGASVLNMGKWAIDLEGSSAQTDLLISGCQFSNNGDGVTGAVRASTGRSLNVTGNTFASTENVVLSVGGTWGQGTVSGNVNSANVADLANAATFTYGLSVSGNASRYSGTTNSWKASRPILATANLDFPSIAVGAAATLTMTVVGAAVGDVVLVNINNGTGVLNTGTALILFTAGVTAVDTVSIRAVNLAGATSDPAATQFNVAVIKAH